MTDDQFDKYFARNKLDTAQNFSFNESKWTRMLRILESYQSLRNRRNLLLLLLIPLLLLAGIIGWGGYTLNTSQKTIAKLEQQVENLSVKSLNRDLNGKQLKEQLFEMDDTIYRHHVIIIYDTIYKLKQIAGTQKNLDHNIVNFDLSQVEPGQMKSHSNESISIPSAEKEAIVRTDVSNLVEPISLIADNKSGGNAFDDPTLADNLQVKWEINLLPTRGVRPILHIKYIPIRHPELAISSKLNQKSNSNWIAQVKPLTYSGVEVGLLGGLGFSRNTTGTNQSGFNLGGQAALIFSNRFRLVGGLQSLELSYRLNTLSGNHNLPVITPPSLNDVFKQVVIHQPNLNFSLGLQYELTRSRLRPYLGISLLAQVKKEELYEFLFENKISEEDILIRTSFGENTTYWPLIRLQAGVNYSLFEHLNFCLEGIYDPKMYSLNGFNPLGQFKMGLVYNFTNGNR